MPENGAVTRPPSIAAARVRLAREILKKVAGPDMDEVRDRIHRTPGPRLFPPGSPIRRVNADASMYIGGIRALLMQSLHPMPMAAVVDHSGYRGDPWGRLARTAGFIASTTFGNEEEAANAIAKVRRVHEYVNGHTPEGVPYTATDPDLVRFIHVAGVDSFLTAHQRYGAERLTPAECDTYVAQAATVALRLGASRAPRTVAELRSDIDEFRPQLRATPGAFSVMRFVLLSAPVPLLARPAYALLAAGALDLLPPWARRMYRIPEIPLAGPLSRPGAGLVTRVLRNVLAAEPVVNADEETLAAASPISLVSPAHPPA
jgi:uncharacterized protein (DUF2236 family)